jgi:hypothetical protein
MEGSEKDEGGSLTDELASAARHLQAALDTAERAGVRAIDQRDIQAALERVRLLLKEEVGG